MVESQGDPRPSEHRAIPANMRVADVARAFVDRYVEAVITAVAADPPPITPTCLVLFYSPRQTSTLPPLPEFPKIEGPEGIAEILDDRGGHEIYIRPEQAPEVYELARRLNQLWLEEEPLVALVNQAIRRLNEVDWRCYLDVSDDFLVFATDLEQTHLIEHVRAAATPERATEIFALTPESWALHE